MQTITFKLNSKAVFNDGTPVALRQSAPRGPSTATPMTATNVIATPFWQQVASIDPVDGDKTRVKIVMLSPCTLPKPSACSVCTPH